MLEAGTFSAAPAKKEAHEEEKLEDNESDRRY
jgi:hypothetical protein